MMYSIKNLNNQIKDMDTEADKFTSAWKDIKTYICPDRGFFDGATPNDGTKIDHKVVLTGVARRALRTMSAGMQTGMTSPARPWFKIGVRGDRDLVQYGPVKEYLELLERKVYALFHRCNVYSMLPMIYEECGGFGTGAAIMLHDPQTTLRGRNFTVGEYRLSVGADGRVNGFGRKYWMQVGALVNEFGLDNVSTNVRNSYEDMRYQDWVELRHLIVQNHAADPMAIWTGEPVLAKDMPYQSLYWESSEDRLLATRGFRRFPVLAPRWQLATTMNIYGTGPGWFALGDTKQLYKLLKDELLQIELVGKPPVQRDASVQGDVHNVPGGVTISSSSAPNAGVRAAYQVDPRIEAIEIAIERAKREIREEFYADLFLMLQYSDRRQITAREIAEKHEEKLTQLGPVYTNLTSELHDPLLEIAIDAVIESGDMPPPPPELEGEDVDFEYISILAQAQKMIGTAAIEDTVAFAGNLAAVDPEAADVLDLPHAVREYADAKGVPVKMVRSADKVRQRVRQRQQAAEQQAMVEQAGTAVQGAKVMSETQLGQNSALDAILSGVNGG